MYLGLYFIDMIRTALLYELEAYRPSANPSLTGEEKQHWAK